MNQNSLPCALVRGGTSKGVFVRKDALPDANSEEILLTIFGTPDARQVDGVGGATPTTSKLMIVGPGERPDVDISYTFGQVAITNREIDYEGNCGNMTSSVGAFAIDEGLVEIEPDTDAVTLRLHNTNTDSVLDQRVPIVDGHSATTGDFKVHGVPGTGARIDTTFYDPAGTLTGELFPLGEPTTPLSIDGQEIPVSVVDVTTPVVFVRASALGLTGTELPPVVNDNVAVMDRIDQIRGMVCTQLGLVDDPSEAATVSPNYPKLAFVAPPTEYQTMTGETVSPTAIDIVARVTSWPVIHPVYAVTSACCLAAAIRLRGTIPHEVATTHGAQITVGHPKGTLSVRSEVDAEEQSVHSVTIGRTQRRLMDGVAYY